MNTRVHVFISGKVQGVFFRSSTKDKAEELNLTGWVRNLDDRRVEAVFEGEEGNLKKMVGWCRKGPEYARVNNVEVISEPYKGEFNSFTLRR
ncbi:MAG: acylphosphatase [Euryarchaeota archaeon]|nr:acylphosphatase [Euryarchaeota archaeon]